MAKFSLLCTANYLLFASSFSRHANPLPFFLSMTESLCKGISRPKKRTCKRALKLVNIV